MAELAQPVDGARATVDGVGASTVQRPRRSRRRHIKFTREGRVFVLVTLGVGFAALNTGNNLMYLTMAFMLSLIVLSGILSELTIKDLRLHRKLPTRAHAGAPLLVELVVENDKRRVSSYSLELEDRAADESNGRACYVLKVEARGTRSVTYRRTPERRGSLELTRFRIGTRYPFSLFDKWRFYDAVDRVVVYPKLEPWDVERKVGYQEGESGGLASGRGAETRELREFRERDEMRRIHWKRSATVGRPIVREMEDEASERVCLVVDNALGPGRDEARIESAISRAAYAAELLLQRGASVEIVARGDRSARVEGSASADPLLRFLALLPLRSGSAAQVAVASVHPKSRRLEVEGSMGGSAAG